MSRFSLSAVALYSLAALAMAGCGGSKPTPPKPEAAHEHSHDDVAPHGGHIVELGEEEYHAELTHDDATKTVAVYLLGPDAKTAVTIPDSETITLNLKVGEEPMQAILKAEKQPSDPEGQASKFSVVDEKVLEALEAKTTTGHLQVQIGGKPFNPEIKHSGHDHDHK